MPLLLAAVITDDDDDAMHTDTEGAVGEQKALRLSILCAMLQVLLLLRE